MSYERWGDLLVAGFARRREVRARHGNGIEGVEVEEDGRRLSVLFLSHVPEGLSRHNVLIEVPRGGRQVRAVAMRRSAREDPELEDRLIVELNHRGSAGRYRLRLVERGHGGRPGVEPYRGIDPRFAEASFVFDVDAPLPAITRRPTAAPPPAEEISYLARDFEGLRQLMLDRLAVTLPAFTERHVPDIWITLVELLAYAGDDLSYYEDAVATEAYLQTARQRISIRRHARLVGYRLGDGCSARAWVAVSVSSSVELPLGHVRFAAAGAIADGRPLIDAVPEPPAWLGSLEQFSPLPTGLGATIVGRTRSRQTRRATGRTQALRPAHNEMTLWGWGESDCSLATGATSVALQDGKPSGQSAGAGSRGRARARGDAPTRAATRPGRGRGARPSRSHAQAGRASDRCTRAHRSAVRPAAARGVLGPRGRADVRASGQGRGRTGQPSARQRGPRLAWRGLQRVRRAARRRDCHAQPAWCQLLGSVPRP